MARKLIKGVNDLETVNPELAKEWNYKKNYPLIPSEVLPNSNKKVWWLQDVEGIVFEWKASVNSRNHGTGNPYLSNQKVLVGYNDLATTNPDLAKEWNYVKNKDITPDMVLSGSQKKVWWIQEINGIQFEWIASISHRVNGRGNPYTSNKKILKGYNDLATTHPKLAEEWNYNKNGNFSPNMIMAGSGKKVWWQKEVDGKLFEWEDSPNARTRRNGLLSYPREISSRLKKKNDV